MAASMVCCTSRPSCASQPAPSSSQPRASASHRCHPASLTSRAGQPSRLHASVAEAADTGVARQHEVASVSSAVRPTPAVAVFPAPAASRLLNDNRAFVEWHRIRGNEVGPDQRTTIVSVANILQETAGNHAVAMWGRSTEGFASDPAMRGLIFVMTRMQIQMETYPRWGDMVQVDTWFQADGKLAAQRDWVLTDSVTGASLGRATSTWVIINMQTRRLCKFPEGTRQKCEAFQLRPARHAIPRDATRQKIPDLPLPAEIVGPIQVARRSDMDMNGHVNNVTYLAWALETVPRAVFGVAHLYQVEIDFKAECKSGQLVESLAAHTDTSERLASNGAGPGALSFVHELRRCEGEVCTELVRARTTWRVGEYAVPPPLPTSA